MASDWFGGITKDLTGFANEVQRGIQSQVTQLQEANEREQNPQKEQGYEAFANESVLDSFFASSLTVTQNEQKNQNINRDDEAPQTPTKQSALSVPDDNANSVTPTSLTPSPNIKSDSDNENNQKMDAQQEQHTTIKNAENETESENYEQKYKALLVKKTEGDAKYKSLKNKFAKMHGKYKQLKEQNEKQLLLQNALKMNLDEQSQAHQIEIDKLQKQIQSETASLNQKIDEKQAKIEQFERQHIDLHEKQFSFYHICCNLMFYFLFCSALEIQQLEQKLVALTIKINVNDDDTNESVIESEEQNEGKSNDESATALEAEQSHWKIMYEELEKTTVANVQKAKEFELAKNGLQEECDRLCNNLNLREEQLAKQSMQISKYLGQNEQLQNKLEQMNVSAHDDENYKKMIAAKDKEIAETMEEAEEWASNCHNLEKKIKKLVANLTERNEKFEDLEDLLNEKEEKIMNLLEQMDSAKTNDFENEKRNKLLCQHHEDTKLANVQLTEECNGMRNKLKAVQAERDDYVQMIEANKQMIRRLNMQRNEERNRLQNYETSKAKEERLLNELKDLRAEMQRIQSLHAMKIERLEKEKCDEKCLRMSAEQRNEELSLEISSSTQPLLRQMESLKNSHSQKKKIWLNLEHELRGKMRNLEMEMNENEANANKILSDMEDCKINESKMEITNRRLKKENENCKQKLNKMTDSLDEIQIKYDEILSEYDVNAHKAKDAEAENKNLQNELMRVNADWERERNGMQKILNSENKKRQEMEKTITILNNKLQQNEESKEEQEEDNNLLLMKMASSSSSDGGMWTVSRIKNELRQKENELQSLKQRLADIESTNDSYSDRIVQLKSQNEALNHYHALYKNQMKKINALKLRYEAAIDIVMEKEKQIQKLQSMKNTAKD